MTEAALKMSFLLQNLLIYLFFLLLLPQNKEKRCGHRLLRLYSMNLAHCIWQSVSDCRNVDELRNDPRNLNPRLMEKPQMCDFFEFCLSATLSARILFISFSKGVTKHSVTRARFH